MKWKTTILLTAILFVTGSITIIEGGTCVDNVCLLVMRSPFYITASPPTAPLVAGGVELRTLDGGYCGGGQCLLVMRNPLYLFEETQAAAPCNIAFNTSSPGNTTYYNNHIWVNTSVTDATVCQYKINDNSWNTIDCNYSNEITFPYDSVVLSVKGSNAICTRTEETTFYVQNFNASLIGNIEWWLFLPLLMFLIMLFLDEGLRGRDERERKDT